MELCDLIQSVPQFYRRAIPEGIFVLSPQYQVRQKQEIYSQKFDRLPEVGFIFLNKSVKIDLEVKYQQIRFSHLQEPWQVCSPDSSNQLGLVQWFPDFSR